MKHLRTVFELMRQRQIYAKRKKCYFMQRKVPYLGHFVSKDGIETDPKKIKDVSDWPEITNQKQLRGFLGLTGYYRRFIQGYADVARLLTDLLKKEIVFRWTNEHEAAKQALITKLTEAPLLVQPDFSKPFHLATDASEDAIGVVLSQDDHPVAYLSRKLSETEKRRPTYEWELLALVHALVKWRHYLQNGIPFTIVTDNSALSQLMKQPKLSDKQAR